MIIRDSMGIPVQRNWAGNPTDTPDDGGDSACRTGLLALCGSTQDQGLLPLFIRNRKLVRHPFQSPHDNPSLTSRDQLEPFMAGLWASGNTKLARELFHAYAEENFFINKDILFIDSIWHMVLCGRIYWFYGFGVFGYPYILLQLIWFCWLNPWTEQNQFISRLTVAGKPWLWMYKKMHPDYKASLRYYWNNWRNMGEVAEALIKVVEK